VVGAVNCLAFPLSNATTVRSHNPASGWWDSQNPQTTQANVDN
jgi:hypothetical protein